MWEARMSDSWTTEHLQSARARANELPRQGNAGGHSPEKAWGARKPVTSIERARFLDRADRERARALAEAKAAGQDFESRSVNAAVERTAVSRALVAHGLLQIRRRSIPLPKRLLMCARIP